MARQPMGERTQENSTLRLDSSTAEESRRHVSAVRWLCPGAPTTYELLQHARHTLGRSAEADAVIDSAGVSRLHAEIYRQGSIWALRDLGSTNGSYLNGARVQHAALSEGDILRLGDMLGVFMRVPAEPELREPDLVEVDGVLFGPGMLGQLAQLRLVAGSTLPLILAGDTGTGKDAVARAAHALSRREGPFHAVNCAALPVGLAEAELFGFRKGAFTGAEQSGLGHLRAAHGGTLFLDEFPDLPLSIQAKLLRALQDGSVSALGAPRAETVDVRVIAASQRPLAELVAQRRVRADLAARLDGVQFQLPPLRERRADIAVLFDHVLRRQTGGRPPAVEPRALERLLLFDWPGNVRELELFTRKLLVLHGHEPTVKLSALPQAFQASRGSTAAPALPANSDRKDHDLTRLAHELRASDGNLARAAAAAGISRQRAYRLLGDRSLADFLREMEARGDTGENGHDSGG
jgi:MoxR-like ATPase